MLFRSPDSGGVREWDLGKEGGHSKRRILHCKDMTGKVIEQALLTAIAEDPNIEVLEDHFAIDLITSEKASLPGASHCLGAYVLNVLTGKVEAIASSFVILATGGCGKVYLYTTNPDIATGDGVAMAARAGVPASPTQEGWRCVSPFSPYMPPLSRWRHRPVLKIPYRTSPTPTPSTAAKAARSPSDFKGSVVTRTVMIP